MFVVEPRGKKAESRLARAEKSAGFTEDRTFVQTNSNVKQGLGKVTDEEKKKGGKGVSPISPASGGSRRLQPWQNKQKVTPFTPGGEGEIFTFKEVVRKIKGANTKPIRTNHKNEARWNLGASIRATLTPGHAGGGKKGEQKI